jgi:[ribosomal protein S18]-alanine N-acetyltransferase
LIIIPAQLNDLPELLIIEAASFVQPWSKSNLLSELSKTPPTMYVTRRDPTGPILGYICFWLVADEIQMLNLAVHPTCRRQGLGRSLMTYLLNLAREQKALKVFLEVRASNQAALALYRSLGFETLYRRPRYYDSEGEDALVMECSAS